LISSACAMLTYHRTQDLEAQGLYSSTPQFYDFLQNRVLVQFKPRYEDGQLQEFQLMLSKKMTYDTVSELLLGTNKLTLHRWQTE
jgi:ubiquitin carboxyl-terminal hydrolase 7